MNKAGGVPVSLRSGLTGFFHEGGYSAMGEEMLVKREGDFTYPIHFENDFLSLGQALKKLGLSDRRICVVADTNTAPLYLETVTEELAKAGTDVSSVVIPAGEDHKNLDTIRSIYQQMISSGLDRKSLLAALGGGVVGDMTGFAAATYMRGIEFIQIPTTLLSQVDSSVGGKTGVDFEGYKNMIGAFHQPRLVYINLNTLKTLPQEEFTSGMGEVVKTGLISDEQLFRMVTSEYDRLAAFDWDIFCRTVRRCCEIKAQIVEKDPTEQGERALLNLGHTIGHAIEKEMHFTLRHGQCVGLGLRAAAALSVKKGTLTEQEYQEIRQGLSSCLLPETVSGLLPGQIIEAARKDKKASNGKIRFILMRGIGHSYIDTTVTEEEMLDAAREVLS